MKKVIGYLVIALLIITISLKAQPTDNMPCTERHDGIMKALKLTPDQEKQFKDIKYQQQKKAIDLRSQIQKNRLEIRHMLANNNVDDKKLLELTDADSKIQAELKKSSVQTWLSIYKILQPEQQEIWIKHFGQMGHRSAEGIKERIHQRLDGRKQMRMHKPLDGKPMGMESFDGEGLQDLENLENEELLGMHLFDDQI